MLPWIVLDSGAHPGALAQVTVNAMGNAVMALGNSHPGSSRKPHLEEVCAKRRTTLYGLKYVIAHANARLFRAWCVSALS